MSKTPHEKTSVLEKRKGHPTGNDDTQPDPKRLKRTADTSEKNNPFFPDPLPEEYDPFPFSAHGEIVWPFEESLDSSQDGPGTPLSEAGMSPIWLGGGSPQDGPGSPHWTMRTPRATRTW